MSNYSETMREDREGKRGGSQRGKRDLLGERDTLINFTG